MLRTPDSPQTVWQAEFQKYPLIPFTSSDKSNRALRYHDFTSAQFWWHNPLNSNSLRLTAGAWAVIRVCKEVPRWKFDLTQGLLPKSYLQLERHFSSPYFIPNVKTIIVFDERDSMMLALHGNNLQQYLDNHENFG